MKRIQIVFLMVLVSTVLFSQNLLNLPESVVYDSQNGRYLVSNNGNGCIVQIDSIGTQSHYLLNVQAQGGLHIVDSVLYIVCGPYGVKGYDLITNENVFDIAIPGYPILNDITSDNNGNLYVSCPSQSTIYKINIATEQAWIFANQNMLYPNGIFFDEDNERLLLVSYRTNSPIQAIGLSDSTVTTVITTNKDGLDGLTRDAENNYYFSSWQTNRVYKINGNFTDPPELFSSHNDDPADIFFDIENNLLAVPLFYSSQIEFIPGSVNYSTEMITHPPDLIKLSNYPNPFNPNTTISFDLSTEDAENAKIGIFNLKGQKIKTFSNLQFNNSQNQQIVWDGTDHAGKPVSSGIYFCKLITDSFEKMNKMILVK